MLIFTMGLLLAGCGPRGPQGPQQNSAPEAGVVTVQAERMALTTELPGRTVASRVSDIRPRVNGLIIKRAFEEGSFVREGDILYQIDPVHYQAAYNQAVAIVALDEAVLPALRSREERYRALVASHAVGQQEYDDVLAKLRQAEAQLEASKANLEIARIRLSYTPVTSPISGRIGRSNVTEGALVIEYQPSALATVQQLDPIYVDVPQSTVELLRLQQRMAGGELSSDSAIQKKVTIVREDGVSYPVEGRLEFRDVTVNPTTGSVILRIVVPNPDSVLLPGMFVRAVLTEGIMEDAILVPQPGISRDQKGNPFAWVVDENGKAAVRMLVLDRAIGNKWLVSSGLSVGDRVIVEGIQRLRPGTPVVAAEINPEENNKN